MRSRLSLHQCNNIKSKSYTSCSLILQTAIIILITQVVNSQRNGEITNNDIPEDHQKDAGFKFRSQDFEVSFDVFHNDDKRPQFYDPNRDSDKEIVDKAIRNGILHPPDHFADEDNSVENGSFKPRLGDAMGPELYRPNIPPECEHALICFNDTSYPEEAVDSVAQNLGDLRVLAGVDKEPIGDRGSDDGTKNLCTAVFQVWYPKSLRESTRKPWHRVVNSPNFTQGIRIGHCWKENEDCSNNFQMVKAGITAVCKQQYSYRQIVVFNPDNGKPSAELFPIPSGCCCHKKSLDLTSARMSRNTPHSRHMHHPWFINNHHGRSRK